MSGLRHDAPAPEALRRALYAGELFLLPATPASTALAAAVRGLLAERLGPAPRHAQASLPPEGFFEHMKALRRLLYTDPAYHQRVRDVVADLGWDPASVAFDPLRLRVVAHQGHLDPRAKAVYYPHRDTWYGHPATLITWWIPLDDLRPEETFVFYPERFAAPVPNDSERFEYGAWTREGWDLKIGWQRRDDGLRAHYVGVVGEVERGPALGFACRAGDNLLFSGAHFHATLPQALGTTRFSLDFRLVHLGDHAAGLGAPNVDNRSRGSALPDYVHPEPR